MLKVVVHEKGGRTQRFNFESDQFSVGREEDNDLVLDRVNISKHHLRFRRRDGQIEVVDLDSTNGTYVNGRKVAKPRAIRKSDRIYVGDYILMLEGEDPAIAAEERHETLVAGADGRPQTRGVVVPPTVREAGSPLSAPSAGEEENRVLTSARRVPPAGVGSSYLDRIASRLLHTVLANVHRLDPVKSPEIGDEDQQEAMTLLGALVRDMVAAGELEEGVNIEALKAQVTRELLELGPLEALMTDPSIREIQVVGSGPIRVVRQELHDARSALVEQRFSGARALVLVIQRLARKWGFLVEGAQVLEGKVDHGFSMYAVLPPTQLGAPLLNLRRNLTDANNLTSLVQEGVMSTAMAELMRAAIRGCRRILICASGATNLDRFMGAVVGEIPEELRVACISDTGHLGRDSDGWIQVRRISDPGDTLGLSDVLGVVLRGGVDMLVSQRCRHEDAASVMDAFAGATRGAIVSLWGIDSAHALWRLAGLSTVAAGAIGALTVSLARSVDLLVRLGVGAHGETMQVVEIVEPRVRDNNEIVHQPIFHAVRDADGTSHFEATGARPSFVDELLASGVAVPDALFSSSGALSSPVSQGSG